MIQFIMMLLLAFTNSHENTAACQNNTPDHIITINTNGEPEPGIDPIDTGGDTGQTPPR